MRFKAATHCALVAGAVALTLAGCVRQRNTDNTGATGGYSDTTRAGMGTDTLNTQRQPGTADTSRMGTSTTDTTWKNNPSGKKKSRMHDTSTTGNPSGTNPSDSGTYKPPQ